MNKSTFRFITLLGIVVMVFGGAGSMAAQSESGSCPWDEAKVVEVSDADGLSSELSTGGTVNKSIRLMDNIDVDADITSSINATIDLNGKALNFPNHLYSINVTGGCLNIYDSSGDLRSIDVLEDNATGFYVSAGATLNIYAGVFNGGDNNTAIYNAGFVNVYGGTFHFFKKAIDNVGTLTIEGGDFVGYGGMTGVYNRGTATVSGGTFKTYVMGIYNAGTLNLQAIPDFGGIYDPNATADIGLKEGSVITMAGEISSLPENYAKIKVGQFSYDESSGDYMAGIAPYVVTSGYKDKVKGIHPAMMFQALGSGVEVACYADDPYDEIDASNVGEAVMLATDGNDVTWTNPDNSWGEGPISEVLKHNQEWADGAVIRLNRNVDIGEDNLIPSSSNGRTSFTLDLNGHLLMGSPNNHGILFFDGLNVTICDSGEGGMIAVNSGNHNSAVFNDHGSLTITGGSFFSEGDAIYTQSGTLTVSGGTFTGGGKAVYNAGDGTATISGGTIIGAAGENSAIENNGTMELGCGTDAVTVLGGGGSAAVGNSGELTVGENVTITSGEATGISNLGTLTVKGFPTFDAGNACDIILFQASDKTNTLISFSRDITAAPANPIKIKFTDIYGNPVTPGTSGLTLTSGYAAHVKRGGTEADKDHPSDPGLIFEVLGVAGGAGVDLAGGEAVAVTGGVPIAELTSGTLTHKYIKGTGAEDFITASAALLQAVGDAFKLGADFTVKMWRDVDLSSDPLDFSTLSGVAGSDPEHPLNITLDLNGCELSGYGTRLIKNSLYSLTVEDTEGGGKILQYGDIGQCIYNTGFLTVKGVTLSASGSTGECIDNSGTLTIDGDMKFEHSNGAADVYLGSGKTLGIGESFSMTSKLNIYVHDVDAVPRKLTTGYGKTVRTPATATTPSKVKAPGDVFTVTNIGSNKLAFAGGEAWVVADGTLALIQTGTTVKAYTDKASLRSDMEDLNMDMTVMLTDDVDMQNAYTFFEAPGKHLTLDLGGHEFSNSYIHPFRVKDGAYLDITDSGGGGRIKYVSIAGSALYNDHSYLSIDGGVTIESTGLHSFCIISDGGSTTFKGWPTFVLDENATCDISLTQNDVITLADGISGAPAQKISVQIIDDNLYPFTSGYGAHVRYPAGHTKEGEPIDPEEVFTYKPAGTLVAKVHPRLIDVNDAAEVELWMPTMAVPYVDADGLPHNDLTDSTPETTDDGHDAYILDGTETTLGKDGTETWYVAQGTLNYAAIAGSTDARLTIEGDVHLILADGAEMKVTGNKGIRCNYQDNLTIYGQSSQTGALTAVSNVDDGNAIQIYRGDLVINGGQLTLTAPGNGDGIILSNGNLTVNGGSILADGELYIYNGNATINGGEFNTSVSGSLEVTDGDITINGGSFNKYHIIADVSGSTGGNVTFNGGTFGDYDYSIYGTTSTTVTGGNLQCDQLGYTGTPTTISLKNITDEITCSYIYGTVTIPQGNYLSDGQNLFGSADADYVFGAPGNATIADGAGLQVVKATPVAATGKYVAYDRTDADWLLGGSTVALYPTGVKFTDNGNGKYTAEVILSTRKLNGVPKGRAVILANENVGDDLSNVFLYGTNDNASADWTPQGIEDDYDNRTDRLPNFIATDGAKTFAELIGEAAGATVSTAEQARDYLVFTLTGDRFVPITFAYDDTPAAGHCLLVVPKINILLHEDIPAAAGGGSSGARRISLGGGESDATGVIGVKEVSEVLGQPSARGGADGRASDDTYFGLDGRRLSGRPSQKGVYIRGGSKVVVR